MYKLHHPSGRIIGRIAVPGSKSETNRLLILKYLYELPFQIENQARSGDTDYLAKALAQPRASHWEVGDAGTAMRFLTAAAACRPGQKVCISGSPRMHERPIGVLVSALRQMGAHISYLEREGYPPLAITGQKLHCPEPLSIDSSVSSQFLSALMLIAGKVDGGIALSYCGLSVSAPYVYLTARLMRLLGFDPRLYGNGLRVGPERMGSVPNHVAVEPDWSAASYWFLIALLAQKAEVYLPGFKQYSLQGDSYVAALFEPLGIESHYIGSGFRLRKGGPRGGEEAINLLHNPDLAQTMAVAYAAVQKPLHITGLQTLRIKETDRLAALRTELEKTGAEVEIGSDYLQLKRGIQHLDGLHFETYQDHRMAMAFAPLALLGSIEIANPGVVVKSYANFWEHLQSVGFQMEEGGR